MRKFIQMLKGMTALAAAAAAIGTARYAAAQEKQPKPGEYDVSNAVVKDLQGNNFNQAITDLDAWAQKFPDSAYKDDRLYDYEQAYAKANPPQPAKALEVASQLMDKDLVGVFKGQPQIPLTVYFLAVQAAGSIQNATPEQMGAGDKAAHKLLDYAQVYFVDANKPANLDAAAWTQARTAVEGTAKGYLFIEAITPGNQALARRDYAAAEAAYAKALTAYPDNTQISNALAGAYHAEHKELQALYEYVRTAALDPTLGGTNQDKARVVTHAKNRYVAYHGSEEGFDRFQAVAKQSPLPPDGLTLKTAQEIAEEKQKEFETTHPDLALWMKIKATLTSDEGQQYFDSGMKDAQVPELKGTVLDGGKCRAKELPIAVPLPDAQGPPTAEITLKLDGPLAGRPEPGPITFTGIGSEFSRDPFMLTLSVARKDIKDLKVTPCAVAPARPGVKKK